MYAGASDASVVHVYVQRLRTGGVRAEIYVWVAAVCSFTQGTHRLHSSSSLALPYYGILNMNPQKGTTVEPMGRGFRVEDVGRSAGVKATGLGTDAKL